MCWLDFFGEGEYFFGDFYFEVYLCLQYFFEYLYVVFLDMLVVFVQVYGDIVGVGFFGVQGGFYWVWIVGVLDLVQGGDVIDVYVEQNLSGFSYGVIFYGL